MLTKFPVKVFPNPTGLPICAVQSGERWRFNAQGTWFDWFVPCSPDGYRVTALEFLGIHPQIDAAKIFELVGEVRVGGIVVETITIGRRLDHTFAHTGDLHVFANDLAIMRWNNWGSVELDAAKIAGAPGQHDYRPPKKTSLFARFWNALADALRDTPGVVSVLVLLLLVGFTLAFTQQGLDLIAAVAEVDKTAPQLIIWLCIATVFLGFQAWFWTRAITEFHHGPRARWEENAVLLWIPRILGLLPFIALVTSILRSPAKANAAVVTLTALGGAFLCFVIFRSRIARSVASFAATLKRRKSYKAARALGAVANLKPVFLAAGLIASLICLLLFLALHVGPAVYLGAGAVVLLAAAFLIPVMTIAIQIGARYRVPAWLVLLALALITSVTMDNHRVRLVDPEQGVKLDSRRLDLDTAYQRWRSQFDSNPKSSLPIVFVAAPGGASRAAFWTSMALATLEEKTNGDFSRRLFAISSISGSSVGAVGFLASLVDNPQLTSEHKLRYAMEDFAGRDFLSPTLAGMFYPDLIQTFVPIGIFPDRARYLEDAFEAGWRSHCEDVSGRCNDSDLLSKPFLSLWQQSRRPWLPILAIGGARAENGRRILTSNLKIGPAIDADDFHTAVKRDVRLSTAIDNGARFPYVSPVGTLDAPVGQDGHIVDGGYFEAAGIETLRELALSVLASRGGVEFRKTHTADKLKVIFIVLSNYRVGTDWVEAKTFASDLVGPFRGLLSSGHAHGSHVRKLLLNDRRENLCESMAGKADIQCIQVPMQSFDLEACGPNAPLDWALSAQTRQEMRRIFDNGLPDCPNAKTLQHIISDLSKVH